MKFYQIIGILISITLIFAPSAYAGFWDFFKIDRGSVTVGTDDVHIDIGFGYDDERTIRRYYSKKRRGKRHHMPPGLAKKNWSHPGVQNYLQKGSHLPEHLDRIPLPEGLEGQLSRPPRGYIRLKVGGDIVLMDKKTEVVIDIVRDIE